MKKCFQLLFYCAVCLIFFIEPIWGLNIKHLNPPLDKIDKDKIVGLSPEIIDYIRFAKQDYIVQKQYSGLWSTLNQVNLDSLKTNVFVSSNLKGYDAINLTDKKTETAWINGASGDGIGEWFSIKLDAKRDSPDAIFTIDKFCMISGYAKSQKTWKENNRVKTALLIIYSPKAPSPEYEYVACRLKFLDIEKLQEFHISDDLIIPNKDPMIKTLWLVIEDIYKGTKYSNTCVSEVVIRGGCLP